MRTTLKQEREARGLSRAKLGLLAGINQTTYSKVELGDIPAYPKYRESIVRVFREVDGAETVFDTEKLFANESKEADCGR